MSTLVITRPQPIRIAAILTLTVIVTWAAISRDVSEFGVLAYPAIVALQTAREWAWQLTVTPKGLVERQGIGSPRSFDWKSVESVVMPDAAWWRINPVFKMTDAPSIQLTAAEGVDTLIRLAERKNKPIVGSVASVSLVRSLTPWLILLGLGCIILGSQIAGGR